MLGRESLILLEYHQKLEFLVYIKDSLSQSGFLVASFVAMYGRLTRYLLV